MPFFAQEVKRLLCFSITIKFQFVSHPGKLNFGLFFGLPCRVQFKNQFAAFLIKFLIRGPKTLPETEIGTSIRKWEPGPGKVEEMFEPAHLIKYVKRTCKNHAIFGAIRQYWKLVEN